MALTGYEPLPSDDGGPFAARFHGDDGRSFMLFGPTAEQAAKELDLRKKLMGPDERLARNDGAGGAPGTATDAGGVGAPSDPDAQKVDQKAAPESSSEGFGDTTKTSTAPAREAAGAPPAGPPGAPPAPGQAPTPPGGEAAPSPSEAQLIGRDEKTGNYLYKMPNGQIWEQTKASGGSPGGLILKSQVVKGGIPEDLANSQAQAANYATRQTALGMQTDIARQEVRNEAAVLKEQLGQQRLMEIEAQRKAAHIQADVDAFQERRDRAVQEYANSKPDAKKAQKAALGTGAEGVLGVIGLFLGTFGSVITKTPNYALQLFEKQIDREMASQEAQMKILGDKASNLLVDLKQRMGSLDEAKSAFRSASLQRGATELRMMAAKTSDQKLAAQYLEKAAEMEKKYLDEGEAARMRRTGEVTQTFENRPKTAASAGGFRPATLGQSQAAATLEKTGKASSGAAGSQTKAQKLADIDAAAASLERLDNLHAKAGRPGVVNTGVGGSSTSKEFGAQVEALAPGLGRALEGNAPNESTMDGIRGMASVSGEKTTRKIAAYKQQLKDRRRAIEAEDE